jgi:Kef-type K+ transport system membrane component KefB
MLELDSVFQQIAAVLLISALIGLIATRMRQPLIVAFIAVGIVVGPAALGIVGEATEIRVFAEIGIALLLFVVGLKLDLSLIRSVGPVALATGLGQVLFTSAVGFGIALLLGFAPVTAAYIAIALTFSSTIIIVKLLSDKREIDDLHGKIAVGFLIVQDIVVVLVMIALTAVGGAAAEANAAAEVGLVIVRGVAFLGAIAVLVRWVMTPLLHRLARSPELLVLFGIAWAVSLAALGERLGFSEEVGAFLAGVSIASTPFRESVASRLVSLRDFLLLFFFIDLGVGLELNLLGEQIGAALVFSVFVLVGNPILVLVIMGAMGYRKRTSFLAGLTVAQISEFSLILAALGLSLGHIGSDTVGLITAVGLITIGLSTYLILYSHPLYERLEPLLAVFERSQLREKGLEAAASVPPPEVIVLGIGRFGGSIIRLLCEQGTETLGVDFDPEAMREWGRREVPVVYGDAEDPELAEALPLERARWVVSTVPRREAGLILLEGLGRRGFGGRVAVTAHDDEDAEALRAAGAAVVLRPYMDAADDAVEALGTLESGGGI